MRLLIGNQFINTEHIVLAEMKQENGEDILWIYFAASQPETPNSNLRGEAAGLVWKALCRDAQEIVLPSTK